ncbi:glycosyltransferase [Microbacterium sp. ARD31]|uniref:glycosyltransferase n=1 Tax=Microbacterium sp. ARD31 TaxID=2962576 RepID=UPI002881C362|nr:glycosyltransferase [Microbacterium sp. ARD31]MDT0186475.1 glycosyltransferase [Microbacterium sp. ARD31]
MGAQAYEDQVWRRSQACLDEFGVGRWNARRLVVRSLRSSLGGNRRLPLRAVAAAGESTRRALGRTLYAGSDVTHRMNLELPPAPRGDAVTLHDIVAWRFPDETAPVAAARHELQRADAVICVSEFTAQEATDFLGVHDVRVVPNGVDVRYFTAAPPDAMTREALGLPARYVLHAGGAALRKNLEGLAAAWPRVQVERPTLTLVLAGPAHPRRTALFARVRGTMLAGRILDEIMPTVVAGAEAVVVPSLYEGFGLPVLEAMAAGVPVVAAATSSLPEVAGGCAILTGTTGPEIAEGLLTATSGDSELRTLATRARAHADGFTWERSALEHARIWNALA